MNLKKRKYSENKKQIANGCNEQCQYKAIVPRKESPLQRRWKQEYYEQQSRLLRLYEKDRELCESTEEPQKDDREDHVLLHCCLALTIFSLIGNLVASVLSGSLSILSTFVDSMMDLMCSGVMNVCLRLIGKADTFNYPRGRQRLEYVGVLICAILMAFANVIMAMQAYNNIADKSSKPEMTLLTVVIIGVQTMLKALLSWICYRHGSPSSIVIAMDLRNDVATRVSAVIFAYIGDEYWRLADPIGAILLCLSSKPFIPPASKRLYQISLGGQELWCYMWLRSANHLSEASSQCISFIKSTTIAISWFRHALEYIPHLVGKRAEQEELSRILKIAIDHDSNIRCLDHLVVYHTGAKALVELHVVMDEKLPLKITHDICHPLEKKLQRLEFVERAFVHCDYSCDGD
ncbi:hypothetical protein RB195_002554 [Necator americanus]|uniref:Cation diffusion facilitator family transporter n=1 Tax=Necator americanus TaxID=51031 RepID=A0ABR1DKC1_NECAM